MTRRLALSLFLFSLFLLGSGIALRSYPIIKLKSVEIVGCDRIEQSELPLQIGNNIFDIDLGKVVSKATSQMFVESASAKIDHRGNLTLTIQEKLPVGYLLLDKIYAVTERAELVPSDIAGTGLQLPVIQGLALTEYHIYDKIDDPSLWASLEMIKTVREKCSASYTRLSEVVVTSSGLKAIIEPGSVVATLGWGGYEQKWRQLEEILATNKNPGLDLDLRFADLAIVKSRKTNREVENGI